MVLLREPERHEGSAPSAISFLPRLRSVPVLWLLILFYFGLFFVFSGMESTLALWCKALLNMEPRQVGYYLASAGICVVIVQGYIVGRLVPRLDEAKIIVTELACLAVGLGGLPLVSLEIWLVSIGFGFANHSLQSLISRAGSDDMRGGTMGVTQSANSLGRITGRAWGGLAFAGLGVGWPFYSGALHVLSILFATTVLSRRIRSRA